MHPVTYFWANTYDRLFSTISPFSVLRMDRDPVSHILNWLRLYIFCILWSDMNCPWRTMHDKPYDYHPVTFPNRISGDIVTHCHTSPHSKDLRTIFSRIYFLLSRTSTDTLFRFREWLSRKIFPPMIFRFLLRSSFFLLRENFRECGILIIVSIVNLLCNKVQFIWFYQLPIRGLYSFWLVGSGFLWFNQCVHTSFSSSQIFPLFRNVPCELSLMDKTFLNSNK